MKKIHYYCELFTSLLGIEQDATPEGVARRVARVQSAEAREEARRVALSRTMQGVCGVLDFYASLEGTEAAATAANHGVPQP